MGKSLKGLIGYLQSIEIQIGNSEELEVRVDGVVMKDFEDYILVENEEGFIDFVTPSFISTQEVI